MARLQDFSDVTPSSSSDKLLIVQSAGQGLATLDTAGQQIANNTSVSQLHTTSKTLVGALNEVNKHLTYDLIATFTANNDTWTATVDGTLIVTATASTTTASYVYLNGLSRTLGSIVCPNGAGGYSYGFSVPCIKGQTYKLLMGGFTSAKVMVVYGTTN